MKGFPALKKMDNNSLTQEKYAYIKALIEWRKVLGEGRSKPDRFNNLPFIKDSGEYINLINQLDEVIAEELNIHEQFKNVRKNDSIRTREDFLFKSVPGVED